MSITARPFKTQIDEVEVEGLIEAESFVFRFYGLVSFRALVTRVGEDERGKFVILQETEIADSDGFVFTVEREFDKYLGREWGYQVCLKRNDSEDRELYHSILKLKGVDANSVNLLIPPRQSISVYFDPNGAVEGSSRLEPASSGERFVEANEGILLLVKSAAAQRILFLSHAIRQMSRPDRMIKRLEVRNVLENGVVIEEYPDDPRGSSCLILGRGEKDRPVHVVCSPKPNFLAIITAYLPDRNEWSDDFRVRTKR